MSEANILWAPQPGPQTNLLSCPCFEVFYGGARGGGKTDGMLGDWLAHANLYGENAVGAFFRRTHKQLSEVIARSKQLFFKIGAKFRETPHSEWVFPNGARLLFRHLEKDSDAENYQGHNYTRVYIEEATNFPSPSPINLLKGTLRSSAGVPCGIRLTGNPGGPGHQWVKQRYIDCGAYNVITESEEFTYPDGETVTISIDRVFIPAKLRDNALLMRNDPGYIQRLRQTGSAALVKAWLDGDWDSIDGAFFSEWAPEKHVIAGDIVLPRHIHIFRAMDWGSAKPFSIGWYAVSDGTLETSHGCLPRGALFRFREWYGWNGKPNTGLKMRADDVARGILKRELGMPIRYGVADPSIFAQNGGPSIAESMIIEGCNWLRGDNARQAGWERLRNMLGAEEPMLYVHESCEHLLRTLPFMQHSDKNPEDLDTDGEDHAVDELRYACMSRAHVKDLPLAQVMTYPKTPQQMTVGEIIERHRLSRQPERL